MYLSDCNQCPFNLWYAKLCNDNKDHFTYLSIYLSVYLSKSWYTLRIYFQKCLCMYFIPLLKVIKKSTRLTKNNFTRHWQESGNNFLVNKQPLTISHAFCYIFLSKRQGIIAKNNLSKKLHVIKTQHKAIVMVNTTYALIKDG